jgi:RNA polymerase sigma factor (sigma-70 family)
VTGPDPVAARHTHPELRIHPRPGQGPAALIPPVMLARYRGVGTQPLDFTEFYRGARDDCLRTVLVSVGDRDTAQDLVAEAFARACASWRTVGRHPAPAAWVVRTALNANVSRWRRRRREVTVPDPGQVADRPAAGQPGGNQVDPHIMAALLRLPPRQRQVIALRLILDLDTAQTAAALGIAPNTVMAHMAKAIAALRDDLKPAAREETTA